MNLNKYSHNHDLAIHGKVNEDIRGMEMGNTNNPDSLINTEKTYQLQHEEFHAKQQLADFTKAAMQGLCNADQLGGDQWIAETACRIARATIEEMIRREKEDENSQD